MPIYEGKKYACGRCIQGHRVRTCNHADRELVHVRDKGRPVTQCKTCRKNRQSNGAHAKCDCGRWTAKCEHLSTASHRHTCCCNHDGICTCCSSKTKVALDPVSQPDSDHETNTNSSTKVPTSVKSGRSSASPPPRVPTTIRNHRSRARPHQTLGPYTLSRGNSNHSMSSIEDLDDEGQITFYEEDGLPRAEDQRLAESDTSSPSVIAVQSSQQLVTPLRLDIPDDWSLPAFYTNDGLFGEIEPPLMSASLSAEAANWPYSLPFPAFSEESNLGNSAIGFSQDSLLSLSPDEQAGFEAAAGLDLAQLNENIQQNLLLQQSFLAPPSEPDYFANAWDAQEYSVVNDNQDLNDYNCDPFFPSSYSGSVTEFP